jgi:hypothetical protein
VIHVALALTDHPPDDWGSSRVQPIRDVAGGRSTAKTTRPLPLAIPVPRGPSDQGPSGFHPGRSLCFPDESNLPIQCGKSVHRMHTRIRVNTLCNARGYNPTRFAALSILSYRQLFRYVKYIIPPWRGRVDATRRREASSGRAAGWGDSLSP